MSGFGLVPVEGGDPVQLPPGETVLGRGPFLGISDTRVSRRHGLLENLDGQLRLKPTHINPCFLLLSPNDDPRPLERGCWHRLHPGDRFSLLPGRFIYRVAAAGPRNSQNSEDEAGRLPLPLPAGSDAPLAVRLGQEQTSCADRKRRHSSDSRQEVSTRRQSDEAPPPPRRRVLPAWMMAAAAAPASKGVKRSKPAATQAPPTKSSSPEGAGLCEEEAELCQEEAGLCEEEAELCQEEAELCQEEAERPRKRSRAISSQEEILPAQTDDLWDESTSRGQVGPSRSEVSCPQSAAAETRPGVRAACPYGKDCYRKNPLHFLETSHPGDADYEEEERPECPYGAACYRKNPVHWQQFSHTQRPAPRHAAMTPPNGDDPDDPDDDPDYDGVISDDSGDESQDDVRRGRGGRSGHMTRPLKL